MFILCFSVCAPVLNFSMYSHAFLEGGVFYVLHELKLSEKLYSVEVSCKSKTSTYEHYIQHCHWGCVWVPFGAFLKIQPM